MTTDEPIQFPILFRFHQYIAPSSLEIVRIWRLKHVSGNTFRMPESKRGESLLHWLIDGHGHLREAKVVGSSREWLRPFSMLWRFTQTIYEIKPGRPATIGELLSLIDGASRDPEKSCTQPFRAFLKKHKPETTFTRSMFMEFMHEKQDATFPTYP